MYIGTPKMREPTLRYGPKKIEFSLGFSRKRDHTDSCQKGLWYYKNNSFVWFSMIARHKKIHSNLCHKGAQNWRKNDENMNEKRRKLARKTVLSEKGAKNLLQAASGLHFWGSGEPKAPRKPQPNGLRRAAERPTPALQASGSRSRPPETGKTKFQAAKGLRDPKNRGGTQVGPGHSGYLKG